MTPAVEMREAAKIPVFRPNLSSSGAKINVETISHAGPIELQAER
jgi:hypothetical protein